MPSASAKLEKQASQEAIDPLKQVLTVIEHKKRNLEKRKTKLETYREEQKNGKELKGEQLAAVTKYDEVCKTLEFAADMAKQIQGISSEHAKLLKKQQRKEQSERTANELNRIKELLIIQDVMVNMGNDVVRADFLAGKDGAVVVTQEELTSLDELYPLLIPKREDGTIFAQQVALAADHVMALLEGRNKEVLGSTYAALRNLLQRISNSGYFEKNIQKLIPDFLTGQEMLGAEEVIETPVAEAAIVDKGIVEVSPAATAPPVAATAIPPAIQPASEQHTPAPAAGGPYYAGQVAPQVPGANPSQFPPNLPPQQPIPPATTIPVAHRTQPSQPHTRPITEVIGQTNSSYSFLQESQVELDTPANVDVAVMLQYPATAAGPAALPPGRNPAAPAASAVPQPDFHQSIPTQTFTNQNFPVIGPQGAGNTATPTAPASVVPINAAHIPAYPGQQNPPPANYMAQEAPTAMPMPPRVVDEQVKMPAQSAAAPATSIPAAPASFAQAAQAFNSQSHQKPQNYTSGAPPGFGAPIQKIPPQQSHFQPLPSQEQAEEQDRADEQNSWANEVGDAQNGDQGYREGGYRGRGGRGRGRGGGNKFSSGRSRSGQQNGGGRSGGYQGRGQQEGSERGYENGMPVRDYGGSGNYKRGGGGPPRDRDGSGAPGRGGQAAPVVEVVAVPLKEEDNTSSSL
ncbi:hypothetical protein B566_EDAN009336 [Ephemera danica]|nr:hypothetical protein B566_EDAN009336 [Ephemera danica]